MDKQINEYGEIIRKFFRDLITHMGMNPDEQEFVATFDIKNGPKMSIEQNLGAGATALMPKPSNTPDLSQLPFGLSPNAFQDAFGEIMRSINEYAPGKETKFTNYSENALKESESVPIKPIVELLPPKEHFVNNMKYFMDLSGATGKERKVMDKMIGRFLGNGNGKTQANKEKSS